MLHTPKHTKKFFLFFRMKLDGLLDSLKTTVVYIQYHILQIELLLFLDIVYGLWLYVCRHI